MTTTANLYDYLIYLNMIQGTLGHAPAFYPDLFLRLLTLGMQ